MDRGKYNIIQKNPLYIDIPATAYNSKASMYKWLLKNKGKLLFSLPIIYRMFKKGKTWGLRLPSFRRKRPNPYKMARDIKKLKTGQSGAELKTYDTVMNGTLGTTMTIVDVSSMAQGQTSLTRIGLKINPIHIKIYGTLAQNADATAPTVVRLILVRDTEQHGLAFTLAELLEGASPTVRSLREHDTKPRFQHLWDRMFVLNERVANTSWMVPIDYKKKLSGKIHFIGTTAADASQGKNNLYLVGLSNDGTNSPTINVNIRFRFTDA